MISTAISRASAVFLGLLGLALLFGSDVLLPAVVPGFPASGTWIGQLLAASWLSIALHNWGARGSVIGGIYGRPIVQLNVLTYAVSALGLVKSGHLSAPLWFVAGPTIAFGVVYTALMFRGPFDAPPPK